VTETKETRPATIDRSQLEDLLGSLVRSEATALHLIAGRRPCLRLQGKVMPAEHPPVPAQALDELCRDFLFEDHRRRLQRGDEVELLFTSRAGARFRMLVTQNGAGLGLVFRRLPSTIPTLDQLCLPEMLGAFCSFRSGLVLLSGFLGSGKSTTLAALIGRVLQDATRHVVTIEESIEFVFESKSGLVHQREVGLHVDSPAIGVREAIRHGADVVVVSELKDHATLLALCDAVDRGLLVFVSATASSIVNCLSQLAAMAPPEQRGVTRARLATCLKAAIGQTLLQRSQSSGRVPVLEILINNSTVARLLREGKLDELPSAMEKHRGLGMQTVDMGLRNLLNRNLVTVEEAHYHALDKNQLPAPPRR
jgi:twitching motility protein PilT